MDDRTRQRQPLLNTLVEHLENRYGHLRDLLTLVADTLGGQTVMLEGRTYRRLWSRVDERRIRLGGLANVRVLDLGSGKNINVTHAEDAAFWEWAIVEVLRHSGVRIEEALELTHLSIRQYQRPNGEVIALLVVARSKSDRERVIPMSAELFAVIAAIVRRHTTGGQTIPLLPRYDPKERQSSTPMPFLFQRKIGTKHEVMSDTTVVNMLKRHCVELAEQHPGFLATSFTPHDFRRLLATELVNSGLPVHIGAALLGHLNLQTTLVTSPCSTRTSSGTARDFSTGAAKPGQQTSTGRSPNPNGSASRSTSTSAKSSWEGARAPTRHRASMSTPV
ncbi:tyrosine-type recombinase/integrase [Streptomyces sp. NPDC058200]|uniref:tyrosine-type recombinase/integrase n=1 Tax=Streptomyces sp. NPDC058200 TaxID=3346378 RepID=UPI0036E34987